jgi:hypothetical protein
MAAARNRANQERLPGTEGGIPELEQLGSDYAAKRDERQDLLKEEVELKKKVLDVMKRLNVTTYRYNDIFMTIVPGEEKLKVKILKDEDEGSVV